MTVNNVVFLFGKKPDKSFGYNILLPGGYDGEFLTSILSFNSTEESWRPAGTLSVPRAEPAVELTHDDQVFQLCPS